VLSEYLRRKNIPVVAEDLGVQLWNRFFNHSNLCQGLEYVEEKFICLNERKKLSFREMVEYTKSYRLLLALSGFKERSLDGLPDDLVLSTIMARYFPEFYMEKPVNKFVSQYDEFSSRDVIDSVNHAFFYSSILDELIRDLLIDRKPLIAGISLVFSNQLFPAFYCASLIRKYSPSTHITIGGPYVTLHFREIHNPAIFDLVDSFIVDEGEIPLEKLFAELQQETPDFFRVPNLIWRDGKRIRKNQKAPPLELQTLPCPDYGVMPLNSYQGDRDKMVFSFRLSRGCYWRQCAFCRTDVSFCRDYAQPEYESVFTTLMEAREKYNIANFMFSDESAHPNLLEYLSKKIISHKLDCTWFAHTRFHKSLTRERFRLFKQANCKSMILGLESYNNRVLRLMRKGITTGLVDEVLASNDGILPLKVYMIIGFPTETEEEARQGFNALQELVREKKIDSCLYSLFNLSYGSDMWKNPERYGIRNVRTSQNRDLLPDIVDIDCDGMTREKLMNDLFWSVSLFPVTMPQVDELQVAGKRVKINYEFNSLMDVVKQHYYQGCTLPFVTWLETTDAEARRGTTY